MEPRIIALACTDILSMKASLYKEKSSLLISSLLGCSIDVSQTTRIPITWAGLNLTGKLIYLSSETTGGTPSASIQMLDLSTGEVTTIFSAPTGDWFFYVTISRDAKQLVMCYIPQSNLGSNDPPLLESTPD